MTNLAFTKTLTAGQPENVNDLNTNLQTLLDALNGTNDAGVFDKAGLTAGGTVRRGKSNITTTESRTNTAYGTLTTPDQVSSVVLPTDGLIAVAYQATWQESVADAARAAIFLGATQLKTQQNVSGRAPGTQAAETGSATPNIDVPLFSHSVGLATALAAAGYSADVTTGQAVGFLQPAAGNTVAMEVAGSAMATGQSVLGGPCYIFAAAGTYTVSVQFKSSSGSVTAKNRKLWVWTVGF